MTAQDFSWSEFEKKVLEVVRAYDSDPNTSGHSIFVNGLTNEQSKELYEKLEGLIKEEKCQKYVMLKGPLHDYMRSISGKEVDVIEVAKIEE